MKLCELSKEAKDNLILLSAVFTVIITLNTLFPEYRILAIPIFIIYFIFSYLIIKLDRQRREQTSNDNGQNQGRENNPLKPSMSTSPEDELPPESRRKANPNRKGDQDLPIEAGIRRPSYPRTSHTPTIKPEGRPTIQEKNQSSFVNFIKKHGQNILTISFLVYMIFAVLFSAANTPPLSPPSPCSSLSSPTRSVTITQTGTLKPRLTPTPTCTVPNSKKP